MNILIHIQRMIRDCDEKNLFIVLIVDNFKPLKIVDCRLETYLICICLEIILSLDIEIVDFSIFQM